MTEEKNERGVTKQIIFTLPSNVTLPVYRLRIDYIDEKPFTAFVLGTAPKR